MTPLTQWTYLGETLSLVTAVVWASSVIFFKRSGESVHPLALNQFKNTLAALLFLPTMYLLGENLLRPAPASEYLLFLASGALGIGIADTIFFMSLNRLGAGLSSIVDCLYSPFVIGLSMLWLDEALNPVQYVGVGLIVGAVLFITKPSRPGLISRSDLISGIVLGILAMACMAVGIVMVKRQLESLPLLWVTEIRMVGGVMLGFVLLAVLPQRRQIVRSLTTSRDWRFILPGSFIGAYIAMVLWLGGMKYTLASTSSALNQTSNIFVFIFAVIFLREPLTWRRVVSIIVAAGGSVLVFLK